MLLMVSLVFLSGIANFALHKAVLESGHPIFSHAGGISRTSLGRFTLGVEFLALLAALLLSANGWTMIAWAYLIYSAANGFVGWLILTGRI